jgi:UTP--glucose-1-phosphate uridylyltransferase
LADLVEKPSPTEAPSRLAVAARYVLSADVFAPLRQTRPGKGGEIQLTDAIRQMIAAGKPVFGLRLAPGEKRYDIGNFESYFVSFLESVLADPQFGAKLQAEIARLIGQPAAAGGK